MGAEGLRTSEMPKIGGKLHDGQADSQGPSLTLRKTNLFISFTKWASA